MVLVLLSFVSSPWHVQFAVMADIEKFKLGSLSWDGDKNEEEFYIFLENFGSMVRSTKHGFELEDMVDSKLRRPKLSLGSVPSFLSDDPDFGVLPSGGIGVVGSPPSVNVGEVEGAEEAEGSLHSAVSGGPTASSATGHFTLGLHHTKYANLSDEAKKLDAVLYNVLKMSIKGSKQLSCSAVSLFRHMCRPFVCLSSTWESRECVASWLHLTNSINCSSLATLFNFSRCFWQSSVSWTTLKPISVTSSCVSS